MRGFLIVASAIAAIAILTQWQKKNRSSCGGGCNSGCGDGSWAGANSPAYMSTAATTDSSIAGVPEEADQPIKKCPATLSREGVH